jgi:hypothetical protein
MNYHYENIRPLTTLQYDGCKQNAIKRIQKRTGDKPERSDFEREFGETLTILRLACFGDFRSRPDCLQCSYHDAHGSAIGVRTRTLIHQR